MWGDLGKTGVIDAIIPKSLAAYDLFGECDLDVVPFQLDLP